MKKKQKQLILPMQIENTSFRLFPPPAGGPPPQTKESVFHCKNNAIHRKINDICIAWMLNHCKNNVIHLLSGC